MNTDKEGKRERKKERERLLAKQMQLTLNFNSSSALLSHPREQCGEEARMQRVLERAKQRASGGVEGNRERLERGGREQREGLEGNSDARKPRSRHCDITQLSRHDHL